MKILVTGANGQLGNQMRKISANHSFTFTDIVAQEGVDTTILDITDLESVRTLVHERNIDVIVNCAAYTNVEAAESNQSIAEQLNAKAPENLAVAMKEVGGLLVHISTDYVFGGDPYNTPCREDQTGTPTGVYGLSKLHGEQGIIATGCRHIIIRTGWLYSEFGNNFVKTMLRITAEKPSCKVVFDQVGTPTYALDLAKAILRIIKAVDSRNTLHVTDGQIDANIYNFSNEGVCSWYDFAKMIAYYSGHSNCQIVPCHSNEFPSKVKRPAFSVLDKTKIKETFGVEVPYWTDSLKVCLKNMGELKHFC